MVALSKLPKAVFCLINLSAISILSLPVTTFGFAPPSVLQSQRLGSHLLSKRDSNDVNDEQTMDRRSFGTSALKTMGGIALSSLLLDSPISSKPAFAAEGEKKKRILVTGSNSGIGMDAAMRMAMQGHEVVLACRTLEKATNAADKIKTEIANNTEDAVEAIALLKSLKITPFECNLADTNSIDSFVSSWKQSNDGQCFDAVCYNAGVARNTEAKEVLRTAQGFELTVGTNHMGHFYLNHLLLPLINKDSGRIVVTASGVHDPESPGGAQGEKATLGDLAGLEKAVAGSKKFDMVDGEVFNADKAYKDSKLCNVLFTRELQRRLNESGSSIKVNAFNPGLIVGTGLFRDQNQVFTKVFDIAATNLLKVGENTHWGGGALEYMTLSSKVGEQGGLYYTSPPGSSKFGDAAFGKEFHASQVSKEARDDEKGKRLWELTEKLVGI